MTRSSVKENNNFSMTTDKRQELAISLLERLNRLIEKKDIIRDILLLIKEHTEFEAVGIRLKAGDDYPYYETNGFPGDFIKKENSLCGYNESGDMICDTEGNPVLECMCGAVLSGKINSSVSYFTQAGSFWTNSTTEFISRINEFNLDIHLRGLCNTKGYESQALIPLRSDGEIIGLLQLNDSRENLFSEELINYFEGIAAGIGIALKRRVTIENLEKSEILYRDLYDNAANAYFSVRPDGIIIRCNKLAEKLLEYEIEELIGKPIFELYADTSHGKEKAAKIFKQFQAGNLITDEEMQMQKADGTPVWISLTVNPVKNAAGEVVESRSMVIDITERRKAEEALIRSEERYFLAQRAASIGSWDWDIINGDLNWSDTIEPMFGFKKSEFGKTYEAFMECVHPDDRQYVSDSVDASVERDEKYSIEHRIIWPNGEIHWVSEEGAVIRDSDGAAIRMLGIAQDITSRKETEGELIKYQDQLESMVKERTRDLYKAYINLNVEMEKRAKAEEEREKIYIELDQIFSTISIGISYVDKDCNYVRFNKRFLEMFQLNEKECSGKKCYDIWNENICRTANCPRKKILSGEDHFEYEIGKKLPDGSEIRCSINSVPYLSMENETIGVIQYYIDITEKREIQKEALNISEKERQRIGSDLHDLIGQNLTASAFITEALKQKIANKEHREALKSVDQIEFIISSAIAQTRKITKMLNPVEMEKRGLKAAIKSMAEDTEEIFKISCKVIQKGDFVIDDIHDATHLYYIAREAVNNSLKHGKPKNITISLNSTARSLSMIIRDDGKGMPKPAEDPGSGLRIMQYRATMIGAEFNAKNRKDGGFQVVVRLPK